MLPHTPHRSIRNYLRAAEAIRSEHADFGLMSGSPSAHAANTVEIDSRVAWEGDENPVSTCVVLERSPMQEVSDLKGATLAFADQASSSGYFMPAWKLDGSGLEANSDYESIFVGCHEGSSVALEQGHVDAACTAFTLTELGEPYFPFEDGGWRAVEPVRAGLHVRVGAPVD